MNLYDLKEERDKLLKEKRETDNYVDGVLDFYNIVAKLLKSTLKN